MFVMRVSAAAVICCALVTGSFGWADARPAPASVPRRAPEAAAGVLRSGERLRVTVHGIFERSTPTVFERSVSREGHVSLPYAGKVRVAGAFPFMAEREVARACAARRLGARPRVRIERVAGPAAPPGEGKSGQDEDEDEDQDTGEYRIAYGGWLRIRTWTGAPPRGVRETRYVLRVGADGNVKFPGGGLLHAEYRRESYAEQAMAGQLKAMGVLPAEGDLTVERISHAEAQAAPAGERVGQLPQAAGDRPEGRKRDLSGDKQVKFVALPWAGSRPIASRFRSRSPLGVRYEATGRLEDILGHLPPLTPARVVWETSLPDGFFDFEASAAGDAELFDKLAAAYETAFGCSVTRERRELPVLVLAVADKPAAEKALRVGGGLVTSVQFGSREGGQRFVELKGKTMADLAAFVEGHFGTPVLDETGLTGRYNLEVVYSGGDDRVRSMDQALRATGLSLTPQTRAIDCVVVREKPAADALGDE